MSADPERRLGAGATIDAERLLALRHLVRAGRAEPRALTALQGGFVVRRRGRGLEVDDIRVYAEGDDPRHLDRNTTARTGVPHTRTFRDERERTLVLMVDLRPSMLWGTLRAVEARMHDDVDTAERLVLRLAAFLRGVLDLGEEPCVPLREEIALLERYLDIERTRLGAPLPFDAAVEARSAAALVPGLTLQPLAEALLREAGDLAGLALRLTARQAPEGLAVDLQLHRRGGLPLPRASFGAPLDGIRARLAATDPRSRLELLGADPGLATVRILLATDARAEDDPTAPAATTAGVRVWSRRERLA